MDSFLPSSDSERGGDSLSPASLVSRLSYPPMSSWAAVSLSFSKAPPPKEGLSDNHLLPDQGHKIVESQCKRCSYSTSFVGPGSSQQQQMSSVVCVGRQQATTVSLSIDSPSAAKSIERRSIGIQASPRLSESRDDAQSGTIYQSASLNRFDASDTETMQGDLRPNFVAAATPALFGPRETRTSVRPTSWSFHPHSFSFRRATFFPR